MATHESRGFAEAKDRQKFPEASVPGGCRVPGCRQSYCKLRSHLQYRRSYSRGRAPAETSLQHDSSWSYPSTPASYAEEPILLRGGVTGFPKMPLQSLENTAFRELLHHFFIGLFDRIVILLSPPSLRESENGCLRKDKEDQFEVAISNPAFCLNFIATSHHYLVLRQGIRIYDPATATINVELVRLLREKLSNFHPSTVHHLIYVILTLVMFDIGQGKLSSLTFHRGAMKTLVEGIGGLHNLGRGIPYVLNLDRIIATCTGTEPIYSPLPSSAIEIKRAPKYAKIYGSFFDDDQRRLQLDGGVVAYCEGVCRAIEILEGEDWHFDPYRRRSSSEIQYFYFLRDRLNTQFAHLNARHFGASTKSRCILLATKILEYSILMNNYITTIPTLIADRIREAVQQQDLQIAWIGFEDVFTWMLFVLLSMPSTWDGHGWALETIRSWPDKRYGGASWPEDWSDLELMKMQHFTWSNTRLTSGFRNCCKDIELLKLDDEILLSAKSYVL